MARMRAIFGFPSSARSAARGKLLWEANRLYPGHGVLHRMDKSDAATARAGRFLTYPHSNLTRLKACIDEIEGQTPH